MSKSKESNILGVLAVIAIIIFLWDILGRDKDGKGKKHGHEEGHDHEEVKDNDYYMRKFGIPGHKSK